MKRRSVQIGLAVILALIATVAVYGYVQRADQRAVAGKQAVDVQLVVKPIPAGVSGKDVRDGGYLRTDRLPADSVPTDAVRSIGSDLLGQFTTTDIAAGQVLLPQMLGTRTPTTSGLAIPDGKMAVTVSLDAPRVVAGYVQPGAEIAVFDTFIVLKKNGQDVESGQNKQDGSLETDWMTKLLLPRVTVLAASAGAPKQGDANAGDASATAQVLVTLAVDQDEAQSLIHETEKGNLYLALLSSSSKVTPGKGTDNLSTEKPVFADWAATS